jgi:amino acid transporter
MTQRNASPSATQHGLTADEAHSALRRKLSLRESAALTFANCGITAGIFGLFGFSLASSGGAMWWGWLIVVVVVGLMTMVWAELASHYPRAGAMYHWAANLMGRDAGWWVGWQYLLAQIAVLGAYYFVLPGALIPLFGWDDTTAVRVGIACAALVIATVINALGVELLGKVSIVGVAAELLILGGLTTLVLIFGPHQSPSALIDTQGASFGAWLPVFIGGGIFMSLWTLFGFEAAGQVGDETLDPHYAAPRAIMLAFTGSVVLGTYFIVGFLFSIPNLGKAYSSDNVLLYIINSALPHWFSKLFLVLMAWIVIMGANAYFTNTSRQMYGMARAGALPFSKFLSRTRNGTPYASILVIAVITALPFLVSSDFAVVASGATGAVFALYALMLLLTLVARLRGWPRGSRVEGAFTLGRWGTPVTLLAFLGTTALAIDLLWPRDSTNPVWKLGIRSVYWVIGIPLVIGVGYFAWTKIRRTSEPAPRPATSTSVEPAAAFDIA